MSDQKHNQHPTADSGRQINLENLCASGRATITVDDLAAVLGIGRRQAYEQCRRYVDSGGIEGWPCIRTAPGSRILVLLHPLLRLLGIDPSKAGAVAIPPRRMPDA